MKKRNWLRKTQSYDPRHRHILEKTGKDKVLKSQKIDQKHYVHLGQAGTFLTRSSKTADTVWRKHRSKCKSETHRDRADNQGQQPQGDRD